MAKQHETRSRIDLTAREAALLRDALAESSQKSFKAGATVIGRILAKLERGTYTAPAVHQNWPKTLRKAISDGREQVAP